MMKFKADTWSPPSLCSLFGIDDIALAVGGSALLSGAASLFGGGAQSASADQAASNSNAQYLQSRADQTPWRVAGGNAVGQINALLGMGGTQGGVSGGGVTATPNAFATPLVGQLYPNQSTRGKTPIQDIQAALQQGIPVSDASWAQAGFGPGGAGYYSQGGTGGTAPNGSAPGQVGPTIDASTAQKNAFAAFQTDPGYQFAFDQGTKALENRGSAHNGVMNGAQDKALIRFGQGTADQQYGEYFNRLQSLAGLGQTAAGQTAAAGSAAANQSGQALQAGGNALASGYGGVANAFNQGAGNLLFQNALSKSGGQGFPDSVAITQPRYF